MAKRTLIIMTIISLCIPLVGCNEQQTNQQVLNSSKVTNADSKIIAQVGNTTITESQFLNKVQNEKQAFERINKPQSIDFYKKVSLGLMIEEILLINEAQKEGITVSEQETLDYLKQQMNQMESIEDDNPTKEKYFDNIKAQGFNNANDFIKSPKIISTTQQSLVISKLINKLGPNTADNLLAQKDYKIFVPVDISGFQKNIDNVLTVKK